MQEEKVNQSVSEEQAATFIMGKQKDMVNMKFVHHTLDPIFRFNIYSAIFGFIYAAYRKSYALAVFMLTLEIAALGMLNAEQLQDVPFLNWIIAAIRVIVNGFLFFPFYNMKLKRKLNNFWKKSIVLSDKKELEMLEQEGGTNILYGAIAAAILVAFVIYFSGIL